MMKPLRLRELRVEYRPHPSGAARSDRQLKTAGDALEVIRPILDSLAVECFIVLSRRPATPARCPGNRPRRPLRPARPDSIDSRRLHRRTEFLRDYPRA